MLVSCTFRVLPFCCVWGLSRGKKGTSEKLDASAEFPGIYLKEEGHLAEKTSTSREVVTRPLTKQDTARMKMQIGKGALFYF